MTGKPQPKPLPMVMMSGSVSVCSQPNIVPVRPKPVIISSAMSSASCSCAIACTPGRNSGGGMTLPAVPCIGSTMIAAIIAGGRRLELLAHEVEAGDAAVGIGELERAAVAVGVRHQVRAGGQRAPVLLPLVADQADHAAGLAVEAAPEADHLVLLRVRLGQADGRLDRLGAAAVELRAAQRRRAPARRAARAAPGARSLVKLPTVQRSSCACSARDEARVGVAEAGDGDAGEEVEVLVAVDVDQRAAACRARW